MVALLWAYALFSSFLCVNSNNYLFIFYLSNNNHVSVSNWLDNMRKIHWLQQHQQNQIQNRAQQRKQWTKTDTRSMNLKTEYCNHKLILIQNTSTVCESVRALKAINNGRGCRNNTVSDDWLRRHFVQFKILILILIG